MTVGSCWLCGEHNTLVQHDGRYICLACRFPSDTQPSPMTNDRLHQLLRRAIVSCATLALVYLACVLAAAIVHAIPHWLWHPLGYCVGTPRQILYCKGYNFWSGIGSDFSEATLPFTCIVLMLGWWHQHNCHHHRCLRLQWHPHPEHGHPVCKGHHPHDAPGATA